MALYSPECPILKSAQMIRLTGFERQQVNVTDDWIRSGAIVSVFFSFISSSSSSYLFFVVFHC